MRCVFALGFSVAFAASAATAFNSQNGYRVFGTAEQFEVFGPSGGSGLFCAAGDFARSRLGARATDRVTLTRGLGPSPSAPGQRSALFQLGGPEDKTEWGGGPFLFTFQKTGQNRSVGHAVSLCERR